MDKKIPDTSSLVKKTNYSSKITEIAGKVPSISGLATNSALTAVENKIPNVSSLVKKTDYSTKVSEIEMKITDHNYDKYITTPEFNNLAAGVFIARLARANLITKADFDAELKKISDRVTLNKTKHLLVENELKKLQKSDSSYFRGKNFLEGNYLVFKPINKYFKKIGNTKSISSWKSKGLSDEVIKAPTINNNSLAPTLEYIDKNIFVKFNGSCLIKQNKFTFNKKIVSIYSVYDLDSNLNNFDPTVLNFLFGGINLTKNSNIAKYKQSGYEIGFDSNGTFSDPTGSFGQNAIIFGADMSSSTHANNKTRNILVLGKGFIQGIDSTTIYAEKMYSTNFSATRTRL